MLEFLDQSIRYLANEDRFGPYPTNRQHSISSHSFEVAVLTHQFALRHDDADPGDAVIRAIYHDFEEAATGDVPRFIKRKTENLDKALEEAEEIAMDEMTETLETQEETLEIWQNSKDDSVEGHLVECADILCAVYDAYREAQVGNEGLIQDADIHDGVDDAKSIVSGFPPAEHLLNEMIIGMGVDIEPMTPSDADSDLEDGFVYFWADWCGPCDQQGPIMDSLKDNGYNVNKIDAQENMEMMEDLGVRSLPTVLKVRDGEVEERFTGITPAEEMTSAQS